MTVNDYFEIDMLLGGVDAFFYFYFFDDLYYIEDIQQSSSTDQPLSANKLMETQLRHEKIEYF